MASRVRAVRSQRSFPSQLATPRACSAVIGVTPAPVSTPNASSTRFQRLMPAAALMGSRASRQSVTSVAVMASAGRLQACGAGVAVGAGVGVAVGAAAAAVVTVITELDLLVTTLPLTTAMICAEYSVAGSRPVTV